MADFFAKGKNPINGYGGGNLASKSDLTDIFESGTTASRAISAGTYFYLNGTLVRAKTAIASGATFTLNTNYEVTTVGDALIGVPQVIECTSPRNSSTAETINYPDGFNKNNTVVIGTQVLHVSNGMWYAPLNFNISLGDSNITITSANTTTPSFDNRPMKLVVIRTV